MKLEPNEDRKPESARKSSKNPIVQDASGWYGQTTRKLLWSDLKDSMILSNVLKSGEVTILGE